MNLGLQWIGQIKDGYVRQSFNQLIAAITGGYSKQHNADDTHGTITATGSISERKRSAAMGAWSAIAFAAANFTASGTNWAVTANQQVTLKYMLIGTTLFVTFYLNGTSVGAGTSSLVLTLPLNATAAVTAYGTCSYNDNGTKGTGVILASTGTTSPRLTLTKDIAASSNWTNVATITVAGQIAFEVTGSI